MFLNCGRAIVDASKELGVQLFHWAAGVKHYAAHTRVGVYVDACGCRLDAPTGVAKLIEQLLVLSIDYVPMGVGWIPIFLPPASAAIIADGHGQRIISLAFVNRSH